MKAVADLLAEITSSGTFGAAFTLSMFLLAHRLHRRYPSPITHPLLISSLGIILCLDLLDIDYSRYNQGGQLVSFFLGPATVALALPLYRRTGQIRRQIALILVSVGAGSAAAMAVAAAIVKLLGGGPHLVLSMIPKSVTTPIAVEIAEIIGGDGALAGVFVVITGILGAMFGPELLRVCGIRDEKAIGLAMGTAAHGIGTGRAIKESESIGAYSGLALGLAGLITAVLAPIAALVFRWL
ncbi:MAG: LrgB family protein [Firmicutes bacterium]|jgi:predicted murein hydrolase (TIGR00659 family)|nr:LrgB family protein [Bacillota bacterium]